MKAIPKRLPANLCKYLSNGFIETQDGCLVSKFFAEKNPHLLAEQYEDRVSKEHTINEVEINLFTNSQPLEISYKFLQKLVEALMNVDTDKDICVYFFKAESGYIITWHVNRDNEPPWIPVSELSKENYALLYMLISHQVSQTKK